MWNIENNSSLCKQHNDSQSKKSTKSITNIIYNKTRSILAICYVDNTVTLQSFGEQNTELTVCYYKNIYNFKLLINFFFPVNRFK